MKINCMGHVAVSEELTKTIETVLVSQEETLLQKLCGYIQNEPSDESKTYAVKTAFKEFRSDTNLLACFVINILKCFDDGIVEYAVAECLMELTDLECYERLLKSGLNLKDIWTLWRFTQRLPQGKKFLFESIVLKKNVCNEICCRHFMTSRKFPNSYKVVISSIQAHNKDSFPALLYLLREFPLEPHNRNSFQMVFRALVLAGYKPSRDFVAKVINKSYKAVVFGNFETFGYWYRDYSRRVPTLKHLCRLRIRNSVRRNVVHAVTKLDIPDSLQSYLALRDQETVSVIFKTKN